MIDPSAIRPRFAAVGRGLNERSRRLFAAVEARTAGDGGIAAAARATGLARSTIGRGLKDLDDLASLSGVVWCAGPVIVGRRLSQRAARLPSPSALEFNCKAAFGDMRSRFVNLHSLPCGGPVDASDRACGKCCLRASDRFADLPKQRPRAVRLRRIDHPETVLRRYRFDYCKLVAWENDDRGPVTLSKIGGERAN